MYEIRVVEGRLLAAIRGQNFLKAHEIQQELEQMQALRHHQVIYNLCVACFVTANLCVCG